MPTRGREARRSTRQETRERIVATATELMRRRSYSDLSIGELMREAGFGDTGRTIFYRHFDDLGDLLVQASREAIDALYAAQLPSEDPAAGSVRDVVRPAIERAVDVYRRHGPLLRAVIEAAASDPQVAGGDSAMGRQSPRGGRRATALCAASSTASWRARCASAGWTWRTSLRPPVPSTSSTRP